ncbi:hypothetical protein PIB30_046746 [Stylosanthes scabra]|uniref:Uncharacterized protein n=1 Tax=Stylosanthes scabra TaxID=79078 RepID=A0ABU6TGY2_9FABA|nr:hypothetical protein [Stylosanthes scabra]
MEEQMRKVEESSWLGSKRGKFASKDNNSNSKKYASLDKLKRELDDRRYSEEIAMNTVSDFRRKVLELETELNKRKESETNLFETLVVQTKQLEQSKIFLEESKIEVSSLKEKVKELEKDVTEREVKLSVMQGIQDGEGLSSKVYDLIEEVNSLKNELKLATEAEENSKKAMDDLAFALKEVATEANQVKAKLTLSQVELEHAKGDAERWRAMMESTEEKYKEALEMARKEADRYQNTAERLRLEAEESLLAWNVKETEFVNCIKRAEEERLLAQQENDRLLELLREGDSKSKDDNHKLRDILKQALNEANVAKEAAEIARAENARLQDSLTMLAQENEMLKIHEAASHDNIRDLRHMLSESSTKEYRSEEFPKPLLSSSTTKESGRRSRANNLSMDHKDPTSKESRSLSKTFSLNLKDMIMSPNRQQPKVAGNHNNNHEDASNKESPTEDSLLKGSIFDEVDSSDSGSNHYDYADMGTPDMELYQADESFTDSESERNTRKRRALLRRFGDLIRRKSSHSSYPTPRSKEPSIIGEEHHISHLKRFAHKVELETGKKAQRQKLCFPCSYIQEDQGSNLSKSFKEEKRTQIHSCNNRTEPADQIGSTGNRTPNRSESPQGSEMHSNRTTLCVSSVSQPYSSHNLTQSPSPATPRPRSAVPPPSPVAELRLVSSFSHRHRQLPPVTVVEPPPSTVAELSLVSASHRLASASHRRLASTNHRCREPFPRRRVLPPLTVAEVPPSTVTFPVVGNRRSTQLEEVHSGRWPFNYKF